MITALGLAACTPLAMPEVAWSHAVVVQTWLVAGLMGRPVVYPGSSGAVPSVSRKQPS